MNSVVYLNGQRLIAGKEHDYIWEDTPTGSNFPLNQFPFFGFDLQARPNFGDKVVIVDWISGDEYLFDASDIPKPCSGLYCSVTRHEPVETEKAPVSVPKGWANCADPICDWCKWHNKQDELARLRKRVGELAEKKIFLQMVKQQAGASPEALKEFYKVIKFWDSFNSIAIQQDDDAKRMLDDIQKLEESLEGQIKPKDPRA